MFGVVHISHAAFLFFFFFLLNGKWSGDVNWDIAAQANRLDRDRTGLSKREAEGTHGER